MKVDNAQSQWRAYYKDFGGFSNTIHDIWIYLEAQRISYDIYDNVKRVLAALMTERAAVTM
jgi:hypothetical protein